MARILVIEDNPPNLELTCYLLTKFGHEVIVAEDGIRGIGRALAEAPDMILCDIQLPGVDGYEIARTLKANPLTAKIPIIAITSSAMVGDRARGLAAGFDAYMPKPIEPQQFVAEIESFLTKSGAKPQHGNDPRC